MNYLREINAFERKMRRAPLSGMAQLLWYKLMHLANSLRWPEEFRVDNDRLKDMICVSSRHTLYAARKELVDAELLIFTPGTKGKPSVYRLCSVDAKELPECLGRGSDWGPDSFLYVVKEDITTYFGYTEALGLELREITEAIYKEFFPGQTPTSGDIREVFFSIMQQEKTEDGQCVMSFPEKRKELLAYVLEQARKQGKLNWGYVAGIYKNMAFRGIKTIEEACEYEERRRSSL